MLNTKIFIDSGNPKDTREAIKVYSLLEGQTTNPSLVAKNPDLLKKLENGKQLDLTEEYKSIIIEINQILPKKSISIEVYADQLTTPEEIIEQALNFNKWVPNSFIKVPLTRSGILAAQQLIQLNININITLNFSLEQAYALHLACNKLLIEYGTEMYISPFIGRLDDNGESGIQTIINIQKLYKKLDSRIQVLAASIRSFESIQEVISNNIDIITIPPKFFTNELVVYLHPNQNYLKSENIDLNSFINETNNWEELNIQHNLTDSGLEKFANDWNKLANDWNKLSVL